MEQVYVLTPERPKLARAEPARTIEEDWIIANVAERALQTPDAMGGQAGPASAAA